MFSAAGQAFGQNAGSITGAVKDGSGAAIAGATVTITNPANSISQTATTNEAGIFVVPQLPPGTYVIRVEKGGFKKVEKSNIALSTGDKLNAGDFVMEVGELAETVQIQADVGQLQIKSESGERSDLVSGQQLRNIGLNGRNAIDLAKLVPGVISGGPASGNGASTVTNITGSFVINGTRSTQHEYTVDGVTNYNLGNNTGALVSVNPDALEEVRILTSNYQAEYGRSGGGFIALTTRSGTNDYHATGRYFRRHDSLNANTFFNNARGGTGAFSRPLYRFNFYGWDLGGPVLFPRFGEGGPSIWNGKQKLFFFVNQEYYSQLVPQLSSVNIRVPTLLERQGNFSQSVDGSGNRIYIKDPLLSGACNATSQAACFPGNIIPANRLYGPGLAILKLFPEPNTTAGGNSYNYSSQVPSSYPRRENIVRIDWQASSSTRLSGRWVYNYDDQQFAYGTTTASWNWPLTVTDRRNGPGNVLSFTLTHNFGATLVNEFIFGAGRGGVTIAPSDDRATRTFTGINTPLLYPNANEANLIPTIITGSAANASAFANTSVFGTFDQHFVINNFIDNLTKVAGKHTFKFGIYYQRASNASNSQNHVQGDIDFSNNASNPLNTGYALANVLLGVYNSYTQASSKVHQSYFYQDISGYAQDTWKITPRLTLDLGIRLSYYEPYHNIIGPESFFNPALYDPAKAPRIYRPVCVGASTCSAGQTAYRALDPATTGTATLANTQPGYLVGKLVPNTGDLTNGLGLVSNGYPPGGLDTHPILPQPRLGFAWDVTGSHKMVVRGGFGIAYDRYRSDISGTGAANPPYVFNPTLNFGFLQDIQPGGSGALSPSAIAGVDREGDWGAIYSYSIGVQRELWHDTVIDVAYVGTQSRHLPRTSNPNAIPYGTTFKASAQDPTRFAGGVIPAAEPGLPAAHQAAGLGFSGQFALPADFLRPYQGYSDITYRSFDANSTYNSLQVSLQRRFARGVTFGIAYTLSKAMTTVSDEGTFTHISDPRGYDYGLATFDRTHFFVANFVWDLPKGSGLLGNHWLTRAAFDNWTISGISTVASGSPAELGLSISGQDAGNRLLGAYTNGNLSGQQPRLLVSGDPQGAANQINIPAFTVPGINDKGPYPRFYLRNPGINNHDLSILKNFPLGGEGKYRLQLRAEMFNFLNHTQFSGVNRTTNITNAAGQTGAAIFNNYTGLTITNNTRPAGNTSVLGTFFGEYNAARDPRIIQLAAKFYF
ncbi:MAG TPA: TonB-dependent receptor [Blastocatellia bacterium]|nr:TonB-dependent receptor [Blastocatellia bacterium]